MAKTALIKTSLIEAMRRHETAKVAVLRLMLAALKNRQIELMRELSEEEEIGVLQKEVKKREEAVELYEKGNRPELAEKEKQEIQIIKAYLPQMMEKDEVEKFVAGLKKHGELPEDFGQAMRLVMEKLKGRAEGKTVSEAVKQAI